MSGAAEPELTRRRLAANCGKWFTLINGLRGAGAPSGSGFPWAQNGLAGVIVALLLLAMRNEWDLVAWLAPRADSPRPTFEHDE